LYPNGDRRSFPRPSNFFPDAVKKFPVAHDKKWSLHSLGRKSPLGACSVGCGAVLEPETPQSGTDLYRVVGTLWIADNGNLRTVTVAGLYTSYVNLLRVQSMPLLSVGVLR
jgi:hypothetical protein